VFLDVLHGHPKYQPLDLLLLVLVFSNPESHPLKFKMRNHMEMEGEYKSEKVIAKSHQIPPPQRRTNQ
jgi:hypothetical protein